MSIMNKVKNAFGFGEDDYIDVDSFEEENRGLEGPNKITITSEGTRKETYGVPKDDKASHHQYVPETKRPVQESQTSRPSSTGSSSQSVLRQESASSSLKIIKPSQFEDAMNIVNELRKGEILIVNTTLMELKEAQRLVDFVAGAAYASGGDIQEVMESVYAVSPSGVQVRNQEVAESSKGLFGFGR